MVWDTIWRVSGGDLICFSIYQRPNVWWSLDVRGQSNRHQNQHAGIFRAFFEHDKRTTHTHTSTKIHLKLVKWPITETEHVVTHKLVAKGTQLLEHLIRFWLKMLNQGSSVKICPAPWCSDDKNKLVFPLTLWWLASVSCLGLSFATSFSLCMSMFVFLLIMKISANDSCSRNTHTIITPPPIQGLLVTSSLSFLKLLIMPSTWNVQNRSC